MRIYIAGPLSSLDPEERRRNVQRAIDAGVALLQKGYYPFIPHLFHYLDMQAQENGVFFLYNDFMELDFAWLEKCDALLYLDSSPGADMELAQAKKLGLWIYYSVADVPPKAARGLCTAVEQG